MRGTERRALHRAALELAEHPEHLFSCALLDFSKNQLSRLAPDALAHAQRRSAGKAQRQGGELCRPGDGSAGQVGHWPIVGHVGSCCVCRP
jgi:hypothetical protein